LGGLVRDHFKALIVETLERYDIDGLELDFMREPYDFSGGKEAEGGRILTGWVREVRKLVTDAAAKRGYPIRLGVHVPSRPEVALGLGLDGSTWAKEGLIDLLTVTPRWATLEFDMPIHQWQQLLGSSKVTLAGGLEVRYQPSPYGPWSLVSPEIATGGAVSVLSRGADAVYLFNFFLDGHPGWPLPIYRKTLQGMTSLDSLLERPRRVGITFRDVTAPAEKYKPPLPVMGKEFVFSMNLGPLSDSRWLCELLIGFEPDRGTSAPAPSVWVNGKPCQARHEEKTKEGPHLVSYSVPTTALRPPTRSWRRRTSRAIPRIKRRDSSRCLRSSIPFPPGRTGARCPSSLTSASRRARGPCPWSMPAAG